MEGGNYGEKGAWIVLGVCVSSVWPVWRLYVVCLVKVDMRHMESIGGSEVRGLFSS